MNGPIIKNAIILSNGKFESPYSYNSLSKILTESFKSDKPLVLHFHGGLVPLKAGTTTLNNLTPKYSKLAGADTLFFLWQSGIWDTIKYKLKKIFEDSFFNRLLKYVSRFVKGKAQKENLEVLNDTRSTQTLNVASEDELPEKLSELDKELFVENISTLSIEEERQLSIFIENDRQLEYFIKEELNGGVLTELTNAEDENTRGLADFTLGVITAIKNIIYRTIERINNRTNHGIYVTIVEEVLRELYLAKLSKSFWGEIKRNTQNAFGGDARQCGGTAFLEILRASQISESKRILLVGHSTGAISICHLLQKAKEMGIDHQFEVVFLAAAASFDLMEETLKKSKYLIKGMRCFGMNDLTEMEDSLSGEFGQVLRKVFPYSLLYFVSGVAEEYADMPLIGMERYYQDRLPYKNNTRIQEVLSYLRDKSVWSVTTNQNKGWNSNARKHGAFDDVDADNESTIDSLIHIIKEGFDD